MKEKEIMSDIKNVKLGFNCPNTKSTMDKTDQGYHCADCSKQVIDFTNKSPKQLAETLKNSNGRTCGIFKSTQLSASFLKYAAATAIIGTSLVALASCQTIEDIDGVGQVEPYEEEVLEMVGIVMDYGSYAEPIGGWKLFYEAVIKNINYPDSWQFEGRCYVRFTVNDKGVISNVKVLKGFNDLADQEVVRALKATEISFLPAQQDGVAVSSHLVIPVRFSREQSNWLPDRIK